MVSKYQIHGILTGIVGRDSACAGMGCVGKEEAGKERFVLFAADNIEAEELGALDDAICCICPIFPRSKF
jgi:hypothetical protein